MRRGLEFATSLCALAIGLSSQPAFAQESSDDRGLEDIVVTARRTSENLQSVPVAITAFSGSDLQQQNARSVSDIAALTPGLQVNTGTTTSAGAIYTLRGQVQQDPIANQDAAVGVYVDGLYWARAYGANADLLDVSGIQVLKGPQGTLFGRNTTGGAVLLTSNDPSFRDGLSGQLSASYGRFNYRTISGVINAPLVADKLAVRVAGQLIKRDGYIHDINNKVDLANLNSHSIRAKVLWLPTDTLSIVGSGEWFRSNTRDNPQLLVYGSASSLVAVSTVAEADGPAAAAGLGCFAFFAGSPPGAACQARAAALFADNIAKNKGDNADITTIPRSRITTETYGVTATLDTSFGAIKAIGGFRNVKVYANGDNDGSRFRLLDNGPGFGIPGSYNDIADLSQYSIEVVATGKALDNKLDFAAGFYYFHEYGTDASVSTAIVAINPFSSFYKGAIKNDSMSGFGQATYHATDKLSFTGGLRYSIDDRRLTSYNGVFTLSPPTPVICLVSTTFVCPARRADSFKGLSYTASIDYELRDGLLVYVKTAKGFRSGGENIRMTSPGEFVSFAPEKAYSYEAGIKSEFLDRRLRVNLAGYYTKLKDQQRTISIVANNTVSTAIQNAGQADVYGAELEVNAILPAGLRLDGTLGYTHPKYVSFPDKDALGRPFERREEFYGVPEWTASISPSWTHDFAFGQFRVRADFSYQSDMNISPVGFTTTAGGAFDTQHNIPTSAADAAGFLNAATDKAHWLVNARASLTLMDGNLDLAVWGKNLTDKRDYVAGLTLPTLGFGAAGRREPRTFGVTAAVKFGAH